jgi:hypothetical protein
MIIYNDTVMAMIRAMHIYDEGSPGHPLGNAVIAAYHCNDAEPGLPYTSGIWL